MTEQDPRQLLAEGWERRSVASEPRLSEAVKMYRSLGFEVVLVPALGENLANGGEGSCMACFGGNDDPARDQVIYTRPKAPPDAGGSSE